MVAQFGSGDSLQIGLDQVCSRASGKTITLRLYPVSTMQVSFAELPLNKGVL